MNLAFAAHYTPQILPIPEAKPIVFVVDGDHSVREALESLVLREGWLPEAFASADDFLARSRPWVPNCLIVEVSLPGIGGLDLQKRMAKERPDMPVIFITRYCDVPIAVEAMKAGAVEFLTKPFTHQALASAIRAAIERSRAMQMRVRDLQEFRGAYESLSGREREVMALVVSGMLNKQVGGHLGISEVTVKAHRGRVMQKMKADSLADLVKIASRMEILATQ